MRFDCIKYSKYFFLAKYLASRLRTDSRNIHPAYIIWREEKKKRKRAEETERERERERERDEG